MNQRSNPVVVSVAHTSNYPDPLEVAAGDVVTAGHRDKQYPGWIWVTTADGKEGWAPEDYMERRKGSAGIMKRAYSAREIDTAAGDVLFVQMELNGWFWVETADGRSGWVPVDTTDAG